MDAPVRFAVDGLVGARRRWALWAITIAVVMTVMDATIASVALPAIARRLHASASASIWVVNGYQVSMMVLLLPFSSAGEIVGYRRVALGGLALFTAASLGCAMAGSFGVLVAARVIQGVGAAAVLGVNSALLRHIYPRAMLGRAVGALSFSVGVAGSIAPSVASAILSVGSWPWLFAVNVPLGVAALALGRRTLPETPASGQAFDWGSAVLSAMALGLLILAVDGFARAGGATQIGAGLLGAGVFGTALVRRAQARTAPLLPVDLLGIPAFALAILTSIGSFSAQTLVFVGLPFYLQYGLARGQVTTGLLMTPWPMATALTAPIAGRLADRASAGLLAGIGLLVMAGGIAALAALPRGASDVAIGG